MDQPAPVDVEVSRQRAGSDGQGAGLALHLEHLQEALERDAPKHALPSLLHHQVDLAQQVVHVRGLGNDRRDPGEPVEVVEDGAGQDDHRQLR